MTRPAVKTADQTTTTHLCVNMRADFSTIQSERCRLLVFQPWDTNSGALKWGYMDLKGGGTAQEDSKAGYALVFEVWDFGQRPPKAGWKTGRFPGPVTRPPARSQLLIV